MDINVNISAIEKLLEYTVSGIGSVAGPMLAPWKVGREAKAKLRTAEGNAASMQIIATAQAEARSKLISPEAVIQGEIEMGDFVTQRIQFQEEKRQANIESVVAQAAHELGDKEVPDHSVDHDWTARFFSDVQDVSSEDMQQIWAKILSGEVERPGSTSIKTLGILKNLDKSTARLFRTLCSMSISSTSNGKDIIDVRVPSLVKNLGGNELGKYGLDYDNLNALNEHGLIIADYNSRRDINPSIGINIGEQIMLIPFYFQEKYWILGTIKQRDLGQEFRLEGVSLTRSGQELSRIVEPESLGQYAADLQNYFKKNGLEMGEVTSGEPLLIPLPKP